jgi:late competence protein required for DNA uptake (superfamily II DNA/RNA helicase)
MERKLKLFYRNAAKFLSYATPLVGKYWLDDEFSDEEGCEWYWQEFEPVQIDDILTCLDTANIEQVSVFLANTSDATCVICLDLHPTMRKTIACGHLYCEECLAEQLATNRASRYKCAACRAKFF